jgi:hypothetical protein
VSGLLPHVIRDAVTSKSVFGASQSFGLVTLTLLIVVLLEREALRALRVSRARLIGLSVASVPLLVAVALTIAARLDLVIH